MKYLKKVGLMTVLVLGLWGAAAAYAADDSAAAGRGSNSGKVLRIAVAAMISPKETFQYYKDILNYIGEKAGRPVELVQKESYAETNTGLEKREIDLAFVCSGPYVQGHAKFGMELLAAPVAYGQQIYYCYIIVHRDSPLKKFAELKGETFAFTDPNSNTGALVPKYELAKIGKTPETYFRKLIYTNSHSNSIKAVAKQKIDGAAVDHLIWEYTNTTDPTYTSQTKIIEKLGPFAIPPVVVHPKLDPELKASLKEILLNMHKDEKGRAILKRLFIDRFDVIADSDYDSVRKMQDWIDSRK